MVGNDSIFISNDAISHGNAYVMSSSVTILGGNLYMYSGTNPFLSAFVSIWASSIGVFCCNVPRLVALRHF